MLENLTRTLLAQHGTRVPRRLFISPGVLFFWPGILFFWPGILFVKHWRFSATAQPSFSIYHLARRISRCGVPQH